MTSKKFTRLLFVALILIIAARFATLGAYPLFGTTEPRYAELARKMLTTGDWVTLWVTDGVPLWGKPPLLFWLDTISMTLLGMTEFSLRLPSFLFTVFLVGLFWCWPTTEANKHKNALITSLVFITTPVGFLSAGFVATDIFLAGGIMLSMFGLWIALQNQSDTKTGIWRWLFFVGIAIGLLAKGPLSIVLLGVALFLWVLISPKTRLVLIWKKLPWVRGSVLTALIAFPWYILHEIRTPGFLRHFIIGEHFERFLVKDWAGGRFAPSHGEPLGMIWWFAIESFLPWLVLALPALYIAFKNKSESFKKRFTPNPEEEYLWCWILAPLLFFSLSRNILEAYVLPALPAFALWMRGVLTRLIHHRSNWHWSLGMAVIAPTLITVLVFFFKPIFETQSQKHLLKHWAPHTALYYIADLPPSAIFYTNNLAKEAKSYQDVIQTINKKSQKNVLVVFPRPLFEALSAQEKSELQIIESYGPSVMARRP